MFGSTFRLGHVSSALLQAHRRTQRKGRSSKRAQGKRGLPLLMESLESRTLLTQQFLDVGPLRFQGEFQEDPNNPNHYTAIFSEAVHLGLSPTESEPFTPLLSIEPDQGASLSFVTGVETPTFTVNNVTLTSIIQGTPDAGLWKTGQSFTFDASALASSGVPISSGAIDISVNSGSFTLNNIRFANPDGGSTEDAQVKLQGNLTQPPLVGLEMSVVGDNFLILDATGMDLTGVSPAVSGSLSVGGLGFSVDDLSVSLQDGQFRLTGAASFHLDTETIAVNFVSPGLVIADGQVQDFSMALTSDLKVGGLSFTTNNLRINYDDPTQTYKVTGSSAVAIDGQSLAVTFGGGGTQGLVITDGTLESLDVGVQGSFHLLGLQLQAGTSTSPLTIVYHHSDDSFALSGTISVPTLFHASVVLGTQSQPGLVVRDGSFELDRFTLSLGDVSLGAFTISELAVAYTTDSFSASLDLYFPEGWKVGGTIGFLDGELNTIGFTYQATGIGEGIEIGDTGVEITGLSGEVQNIERPENLIVSGSLTVAWGANALIQATGAFKVDRNELVLSGDVKVFDGMGEGSGTLVLDWGAQNYSLDVGLSWYDGTFQFNASIDLSQGGEELYLKSVASVHVPDAIPFIGGKTLADLDLVLEYRAGQPSESFVAAWVHVHIAFISFDAGVKVDFNGTVSYIGSHDVDHIDSPPPDTSSPQVWTYTIPFQVPDNVTQGAIHVQWPEIAGNQSVSIIPTGNNAPPIPQSEFSAANGLSLVPAFNSRQSYMVAMVGSSSDPFHALPGGTYSLQLVSNYRFSSNPTLTTTFGNARPTIEAPSLASNANLQYQVNVQGKVANTLSGSATASLFMDTAEGTYGGVPIPGATKLNVTQLPDNGWSVEVPWDLSGLLPEPFFVYAMIDDGVNPPVFSSYSGPVTPTPALSGQVLNPLNSQAIGGILVYIDRNGNGSYDPSDDPSAITDKVGFYSFSQADFPAFPFDIRVVIPAGYRLHPGTSDFVQITGGDAPFVADFQLDEYTAIQGYVTTDLSGNSQPLTGWTVYLDLNNNGQLDPGEPTALTNVIGLYSFHEVPLNSTQVVRLQVQDGYYLTSPSGSGAYTVNVGNGEFDVYDGNDFGVWPFSTIRGTVSGYALGASSTIGVSGFVPSLYRVILGREPSVDERDGWADVVRSGASAEQVAARFWNAPEHLGLQVDRLYRQVLGRAADPEGFAAWVNALQDGQSLSTVALAFLSSQEFRNARPLDVLGDTPSIATLDSSANPLENWTIDLIASTAINAGGNLAGGYLSDVDFQGGQTTATSHSITIDNIDNPAPLSVYQSNRAASRFSYVIPEFDPGETYTVRLHFVETEWDDPGDRIFDVSINNQPMLTQFDILQSAGGKFIAITRSAEAVADAEGTITIDFVGLTDNAQVNGIEISRPVASTTTDAQGTYTFDNVKAGSYQVSQEIPSGWREVSPFASELNLLYPDPEDRWHLSGGTPLPASPIVGDFLNDGKLDFAVVDRNASSYPIWIFANGQFGAPMGFEFTDGLAPSWIVSADIYGTGRQDIAAIDVFGHVNVLRNDGGLNEKPTAVQGVYDFWPGQDASVLQVAKGRFVPGDSGEQLALLYQYVEEHAEYLSLVVAYQSGGQPAYTELVSSWNASYFEPGSMAVGDINADGWDDLLVGFQDQSPQAVFGNASNSIQSIDALPSGQTVVLGDISGDGLIDLGVYDQDALFHGAIQDQAGNFSAYSPGVGMSGHAVGSAFLQDVNGDLKPDLVWVSEGVGNQALFVVLNSGEQGSWLPVAGQTSWFIAPGAQGGLEMVPGDFSGNGLADLIVLDQSAGNAELISNASTTAPVSIFVTVDGGPSTGNDFVNTQVGQISGRAFDDLTRDGINRPAKPGHPGAVVYLDLNHNGQLDPDDPQTTSGTDGHYAFDQLSPGTYSVRIAHEAGRRITTPDVHIVTIGSDTPPAINRDFGNVVGLDVTLAMPGTSNWTILRNRDRLEIVDDLLGVVSSHPFMEINSLTIEGAGLLTIDLLTSGPITLPGGLSFLGKGETDSLRIIPGSGPDNVAVTDGLVRIDGLTSARWKGVEALHIDAQPSALPATVAITPMTSTAVIVSGAGRLNVNLDDHPGANFSYEGPGAGRWSFSDAPPVNFSGVSIFNAPDNVLYVLGLYQTVLTRVPLADELNPWIQTLDAGAARSRLARAFWRSPEHRGLQVDRLYQQILDRPADPDEQAFWTDALRRDAREAVVSYRLFTSAEYRAGHPDLADFLDGLYQTVLGRAPDVSERSLWTQAVDLGLNPNAIPRRLLTSEAATRRLVALDYATILGRDAPPRDLDAWTALLRSGRATPSTIAERFLASDAFLDRFRS